MEKRKQKYMNPITFEAELFVNYLESLSKTYNYIDAVLVSSLEKVMIAIEKFLDSNPTEIVETKNTKLMKCVDVSHIKRIYHCTPCKRDLGKSVEKVTLHVIEECNIKCGVKEIASGYNEAKAMKSAQERELKKPRDNLSVENNPKKKKYIEQQTAKLSKKTQSLLTTNLNIFIADQTVYATKFKRVPAYDKIERQLQDLLNPLFPNENVKIYKFGSRIAGIGNQDSDLDLYIDIGDTFNVLQNRVDNETLIKFHQVGNALKNDIHSWKGLVKIDKARVPVLNIINVATGIECDINFSNSMGTINTKYLEYIFNLQPIAQLLCIFMKQWLYRTKLNDEVNTYSMSLMILFYLQTLKVIPSMKLLQQNINHQKALKVGPWLCTYATMTLNELNIPLERVDQPNMLKFVRGFFNFYKNFKFSNNVICPYLGETITKANFKLLMPTRYIDFVKQNPDFEIELDKPIVVQDPLQLNHNTTKSLSDFSLKALQDTMINSLELLNDNFLDDV